MTCNVGSKLKEAEKKELSITIRWKKLCHHQTFCIK